MGVLKWISNPTCLISIFKTRTTRALSSALKVTEKLLRAQSRGQTYEHRLEAICLPKQALCDRFELSYIEAEYFLWMLPIIY